MNISDALTLISGMVMSGRWPSLTEWEKQTAVPKGVDGLAAMLAGI